MNVNVWKIKLKTLQMSNKLIRQEDSNTGILMDVNAWKA